MDKYIIGESSSGKTRAMLEEAMKSGAIVVCKNPLHMQNKANAYGLYGIKFKSYDDIDFLYNENVAIDELGDFFKQYFRVELDSFTMTVD
jgi:hypothetical protein